MGKINDKPEGVLPTHPCKVLVGVHTSAVHYKLLQATLLTNGCHILQLLAVIAAWAMASPEFGCCPKLPNAILYM